MFSGLLQKDQFKGRRSLAKRYLKTKLLSRLSHKVCRLLTSLVRLPKFTTVTCTETQAARSPSPLLLPPPKNPPNIFFIDGVVSQMIPSRKWSPDRKWSPKFDRKWIVENLIKDQSKFALVIISLILIIFSLDNLRTLLGEILCWSLLGPKVQIRSLLIGKLT